MVIGGFFFFHGPTHASSAIIYFLRRHSRHCLSGIYLGYSQSIGFGLGTRSHSFNQALCPSPCWYCRVSSRRTRFFCFGKRTQNHVGHGMAPRLLGGKLFGFPARFADSGGAQTRYAQTMCAFSPVSAARLGHATMPGSVREARSLLSTEGWNECRACNGYEPIRCAQIRAAER